MKFNLILESHDSRYSLFTQESGEEHPALVLSPDQWRELGAPEAISITVEKGL